MRQAGGISNAPLPHTGKKAVPHESLILRARIVVPVSQPPLEDGAVVVSGDRVRAVGPWSEIAEQHGAAGVLDLGEVVVLPGLINAHCHLDYTDMAGQIPPMKSFPDWIKSIMTLKAGWSYTEFARSWLDGADMLLHTGTTTVADIEAVPELLPEVWQSTPLRVHSFLEMTGVRSRRGAGVVLEEALTKARSLRKWESEAEGTGEEPRASIGLSPHAPYSTTPELIRLAVVAAEQEGFRLTTHIAESKDEFEMFQHGRGELHRWLAKNERDNSDCGCGSPVQVVNRLGLLSERLLAVHLNYLSTEDAALLGGKGVHVVHCPRSHEYFGHGPFPFEELAAAGVNICLGTDSLATTRKARRVELELNMLREMQRFAKEFPNVPVETVLRMATINGARALGRAGDLGELTAGAFADLVVLPLKTDLANAVEDGVHFTGRVSASMIAGRWAIAPD